MVFLSFLIVLWSFCDRFWSFLIVFDHFKPAPKLLFDHQKRSLLITFDQNPLKTIKIDHKTIKIDQSDRFWSILIVFDRFWWILIDFDRNRASPPKKRFTLNCELRFTTTNVSRLTLTTESRLTMPLLSSQKHDSSFHPFVSSHGAALGAARPGLYNKTTKSTSKNVQKR